MNILSLSLRHPSATLFVAIAVGLLGGGCAPRGTTLFFDDFSKPTLNSAWQASLPNAKYGSGPPPVTYVGAPAYSFQTLDGASVLRMGGTLNPTQRRGWSTGTVFAPSSFRYEVRFNTLNQSDATSIDAFLEIWIFDPSDTGRYDIVSPFGANWSSDRRFFVGSGIDNSYSNQAFNYRNNTWYRLVLEGAPGQNIRASLCNDAGAELIGQTFSHGAGAYNSGFELALSQAMGSPIQGYGPTDVAVDYVRLTVVPEPGSRLPGTNANPRASSCAFRMCPSLSCAGAVPGRRLDTGISP